VLTSMSSFPGKQPPPRLATKPGAGVASTVGTAQKVTSSPNRTGVRPAGATIRAQSPTTAKAAMMSAAKRSISPEPQRRPKTPHSRSSSLGGITEGIGNLNRWSQSTVSSKASGGTHKRRNSFARRLSGSFSSLAPFTNPQSPPTTKNYLIKPNQSPSSSPQRPPPSLPPVYHASRLASGTTLSSSSYAVESANTPSPEFSITPATADLPNSGINDYFGETWTNRSPPRHQAAGERLARGSTSTNSTSRSQEAGYVKASGNTGSISAISSHSRQDSRGAQHRQQDQPLRTSHTRNSNDLQRGSDGAESNATANHGQAKRRRRHKEPSQKIMLSKALQKANHAVLLDSAQNVEGAVAAYKDACDLLQQVMIRSSTDDDRRKLEVIVGYQPLALLEQTTNLSRSGQRI
jgi:hypothetical protein